MAENQDNIQKELIKNYDIDFLKGNFGVSSDHLLKEIVIGAVSALPCTMSQKDKIQAITQSTYEMKPKDPIETKLCTKEAVIYSLAMKYVQRAEVGMFSEQSDIGGRMWYETNMNFAIKLLRLHNETIETLNRYKRGGEQKVTVQHQYGVQVNEGGQAIVGNLMGGGGSEKK